MKRFFHVFKNIVLTQYGINIFIIYFTGPHKTILMHLLLQLKVATAKKIRLLWTVVSRSNVGKKKTRRIQLVRRN